MKHFLFTFLVCIQLYAQPDPLLVEKGRQKEQIAWVEQTYASMSLKEKIGQLFMPMVFSRKDSTHFRETLKLIEQHHIGGLIFSLGGPNRQSQWLNAFQKASKTPLLVAMDAEWGPAMRLDSVVRFPWQMTLGAIQDTSLIRKIGQRMGEQEKRLGVHFSFSPVLDVNTNPKNPIIGNRSFGEDAQRVSAHALALMQGHHQMGILTSGKHFPGHGDTAQDSHKTLPTVFMTAEEIDNYSLAPYRTLIQHGLTSVMVAHLNVPGWSPNGLPTSLSPALIQQKLKKEMGFKGLIVTDALNMKGVSKFASSENVDVMAFLAGHDLLLISNDIPKGIAAIEKAFHQGKVSEERLAYSVKKILKAKFKAGLHQYKPVELSTLHKDLNSPKDTLLYSQAMAKAITLVKNENKLLPLREHTTLAHITLGDASGLPFHNYLNRYAQVPLLTDITEQNALDKSAAYDTLIVSFHRSDANPWKAANFSEKDRAIIKLLATHKTVILNAFVRPYALMDVADINTIETILWSYQNSVIAQQQSAAILFGTMGSYGKLPISVGKKYPVGHGLELKSLQKFSYASPAQAGFDPVKLKALDTLAQIAIDSLMTPGMQMLVARRGKIIYHKSFGYHTYAKKQKVANHHLYDLASLTKILGTLPLVMKAVDRGALSLQTTVADILPDWRETNKASLSIKRMLSHYAQLTPWIPFYEETLTSSKKPDSKFYATKPTNSFSVPVAKNLYLKKKVEPQIQKAIKESPLLDTLGYIYSDLPYYLLKEYFETKEAKGLDILVDDIISKPLKLKSLTYNPYLKFPDSLLVPSEKDTYFRNRLLQGYVHDMGAAMQGGVGGHAGLFGTAYAVAVVMQMYLQGGYYNGQQLVSKAVIDQFNECYFCSEQNRRGVGFDKPEINPESANFEPLTSNKSFGHFGFTGTYAWADPEKEMVIVFLSNRTYPTMENKLLGKHNIRTRMRRLVYDAMVD